MNRPRLVLGGMSVGYSVVGVVAVVVSVIMILGGSASDPTPRWLLAFGVLSVAISGVGLAAFNILNEQATRIADLERRLSAAPDAVKPAGLPAHSPQAPHDPSVPP
jgi:hypothetical protein